MLIAAIAALLMTAPQSPPSAPMLDACQVAEAERDRNRLMTFEAFDQAGDGPATARKLGERGCNAAAAEATENYLLNGPLATDAQRAVLTWHLAQFLALDGQEREAARLMAASRRAAPEQPDGFDWNAYVAGSAAFLRRDRPALDQAAARLAAAPGVRNQMNARVLGRLQRCFDRSYAEAYVGPACAAP